MNSTHALSLLQQIKLIKQEVLRLPVHEVPDQTAYPNRLQQVALLKRAFADLISAEWALEEYHNGIMKTFDISKGV